MDFRANFTQNVQKVSGVNQFQTKEPSKQVSSEEDIFNYQNYSQSNIEDIEKDFLSCSENLNPNTIKQPKIQDRIYEIFADAFGLSKEEVDKGLEEERQKRSNVLKAFMFDYKDTVFDETTPVTEENKEEILEKFHITHENDIKDFEEKFEKYDVEVVTNKDGVELLRFKDKEGRPVYDYMYDGSDIRWEMKYTYFEDGSYLQERQRESGMYFNGVWTGFMNDGVAYPPMYVDQNGIATQDKYIIEDIIKRLYPMQIP